MTETGSRTKMSMCAHRQVKRVKLSDKTLWPSGLRRQVATLLGFPRGSSNLSGVSIYFSLLHTNATLTELSNSVLILLKFRRIIDSLLLLAFHKLYHRISDSGPMVRVLRCQRGDSGSIPGCCIHFLLF